MHRFIRLAVLGCSLLACALGARADYPDKPIRFVAATTAGGTADLLARALADAMSKVLNQPIIVDNKPGADQIIGMEFAAKGQPADGYTAIVIGLDGQALLPLVKKGALRFDPMADLTQVAYLGDIRYVIAGPATAPYKTFKELMDAAKANPGKMNYGSSSPQGRFPSLLLLDELKLEAIHVPFPGAGPYLTAVAAGTVDWVFIAENSGNTLKPRVRLYGITGRTRSPSNPEVPTFAELGHPRVLGTAYSLAVRTGTPQAIIDKLSAAAATAMATPEMKASAQKILFDLTYEKAEGAQRILMDRYKLYEEFAKKGALN